MALISQDVDSLIGGVSEQPAEIRKDSQVTEAFNVSLDPSDGLSTRSGTRLVTNSLVQNATGPGQELFWASVDNGPGKRFVLKLAIGTADYAPELKAINVETGTVQDVSIPSESVAYLSGDGVTPFFTTTTIGDTTFITNDTITVEMDDIAEPVPPLQACFWFRAPVIDQEGTGFDDFKFSATNRAGDRTANFTIEGDGLSTSTSTAAQQMARLALQAINAGENGTGYEAGSTAYGLAHEIDSPQPPYGGDVLDVLGTREWNAQSGFPPNFDYDSLPGEDKYKWTTDPQNPNYMGGGFQRGWFLYALGFNPKRDGYELNRNGPSTGTADDFWDTFMGEYYEDTDCTGTPPKLPIQWWRGEDVFYTVESGSDTNAVFFSTERGPKIESLPPAAEDGMTVPIVDDDESDGSYYLKFNQAQGAWVEGRKLGEAINFKANTMPHVIKYNTDSNSFSFETYEWADRKVGDLETNTLPSFVGGTVNDILLYRDRLAIASGNTITCSEVKEIGNFWRTSMVTLVDSDRLDLSVSGGSDGSGTITSLNDSPLGLLITTDRSQYLLSSGDNAFVGSEVKMSRLSQSPVHPRTPPVASNSRFFWTTYNGRHSNVWEYMLNNDAGVAIDVTGHCSTYIQGEIISSASDELENRILFLNSLGDIYVFQHLISGEQRVQAAWSRWDLGATGVEHRPRYVTVIAGKVYIATGYALLELLSKDIDDPCGWQCSLDGRVEYTGGFSYDPNTQTSTGATQYQSGTWANNLVDLDTGIFYPNIGTVSTPKFKGQLNPQDNWVWGDPISTKVELSPFVVKTIAGSQVKPYLGGRTQLRTLTLNCFKSGPFKVITDIGGDVLSTEHDNSNIDVGGSLLLQPPSTVEFITDVGGRNTETTIRIEAQSTQPITVTSLRYEVLYHRRGN